jgi:beta-1,4-mannosyltransferase
MKKALFSRYNILHVHWPEYIYRRRTAGSALLTQILTGALLLRLFCAGTPIVRTLHNISPHEKLNWREKILQHSMDKLTTRWIYINSSAPRWSDNADTILHGHYCDWFSNAPKRQAIRGRLLFFGLIRPYKGIEALLDSFRAIDDQTLSLHVVGNPQSTKIRQHIEETLEVDPRIHASLRYVADDELSIEITNAEMVILPYRQMHNSGALLLALSLNRPVLAPWSENNAALQEEVGSGWIHLYTQSLDGARLLSAIEAYRSTEKTEAPNLRRREWRDVGHRHYEIYLKALSSSRRQKKV